ncbi:uncharacterized protein LAESUDRAFT_665354 [Laetiporus sulphureus 93-53]|uniref:Kinase-like protein n=1 Tax=Laetiporus sulphureus 93-53 TaxID=1314785 RepID=A0A165BD71_9APHY|nr:uncharacterized protein LAESUDRAFT_665354 [Laetiporus sulphureus 93-53]KZT00784.1 hypothetical protein LAESUDRAFT_665354 [Laetiporus sulphureus 93-53]
MDPSSSTDLSQEREHYRARIVTALEEDPDPLSAYDSFVKWTLDNYPKERVAHSGLLELLEEATRQFKDDPAYRGDLRYLKLWSLYASHVEDPATIYAFLLTNDIGTVYAQTYWEYAAALEKGGRRAEADAIFKQGIKRRARPVDPLKRRYDEFKNRSSSSPNSFNSTAALWRSASPKTQALRRHPLKNYPGKASASPSHSGTSGSFKFSALSDQSHDRYAPMLAPPVPGRRPEKLRFDLSLLFTEDGTEYSMQEARAKSMGLLGKKWAPPPPSDFTVPVNFKEDGGARSTGTYGKKRFRATEPTVTLATKEALADVFTMYNSPEKTARLTSVAGSKYAPVHKVEPDTPMAMQTQVRASQGETAKTPRNNENANVFAKTPIFTPFHDENADRKENTPAVFPKLKPLVDSTKKPVFTPRQALSAKDSVTPATTRKPVFGENSQTFKTPGALKPVPEEPEPKPVLPPVFTPAPRHHDDVDAQSKADDISTVENVSAFTPFRDPDAPMRVFSRPPARSENASVSAPPGPVFRPYVDNDEEKQISAPPMRRVLGERTPLRAFAPPPVEEPDLEEEEDERANEDSCLDNDGRYAEYAESAIADETAPVAFDDEDHTMYGDEDTGDYHQPPLGGRWGPVDVMTPITERTFEYTLSTRGTPSEALNVYRDPVEAAEQLAAELQRDDEEGVDGDLATSTIFMNGKPGHSSLSRTLEATSAFRPANPCNPFDPPIITTLLSLIPPDHEFHNLKSINAGHLDALQKFAKKKSRRTSGNTSSRFTDDLETLPISLSDRNFAVIGKLGEGGFGAVFEAIDLDMQARRDEEDEDEDDDDAQDKCKVALKVVKPRNLWEYHVLRRIHRSLPTHLTRSIVIPQALYAYRDESYLVLELCKQGTLLDIVNRAAQAGITQQGACLDELLVMFFSIELMRLLEGLHRAGFIHGDMKIDNCLLRLEDVPGPSSAWSSEYDPSGEGGWSYKGIKLIDFGRTIDTGLFPANQRFIAEWPTDARDCLEIREGRPWTYQTDYFGLAGIIYCMLYGKYIEASSIAPSSSPGPIGEQRYKLAAPLKRYWQGEIWTRLFDLLINPCLVRPDSKLPVCDELAELRVEMEVWLQANCNRASNSLKGLLKKIGIYILKGSR